tara:strand:- start:3281 stop:4294 length:1014 start_codon:yes stop_codon:yes gene_type:complete
MIKKSIVIINNEKIFKQDEDFFCKNFDVKVLTEGLSEYHNVEFIARNSKKKGENKINLQNIKSASNIFIFLFYIFKTLKTKNVSYLLIDITPYNFFSFLILFIFRKKIFVYLRSSGHEEWKYILGRWSVWIYHIMYKAVTSSSTVMVLNKRLSPKKDSHMINVSRLDDLWFIKHKEALLDKIRLLYVGRINPEKGIYDFIQMFKKIDLDIELSIAGDPKNLKISNNNIKLLGYISDPQSLIDVYDSHNIIILPSYTEGQPYILDESLSRHRPILVFEDIAYITKDKNGAFVSKRDTDSFVKSIKYIMDNYKEIQKNIIKNKFMTRKDMLKQISDIIS